MALNAISFLLTIVRKLFLQSLIFRLIISYFRTLRMRQIAPFLYKSTSLEGYLRAWYVIFDEIRKS